MQLKNSLFALILFPVTFLNAQTADDLDSIAQQQYLKKEYKTALKTIDKALAINDKEKAYYLTKIDILIELEDFENIGKTFAKAMELFPTESNFYNRRGILLNNYQQYDMAMEDFNAGIAMESNDTMKAIMYSNRSISKSHQRDFYGAYQDLKMAYDINKDDIGVLMNLGAVCDEVGKSDETLIYLKRVIELDPEFVAAYVNMGFHHQEKEEHQQAIAYFDKALEREPDMDYAYNNRGYSKFKSGDIEGALKDVNKAIDLGPYNAYAYRNRALIYIEQGKTKKACSDIEKALEYKFTERYGDEMVQLQKKHCY